jgi:hypothetical protein
MSLTFLLAFCDIGSANSLLTFTTSVPRSRSRRQPLAGGMGQPASVRS